MLAHTDYTARSRNVGRSLPRPSVRQTGNAWRSLLKPGQEAREEGKPRQGQRHRLRITPRPPPPAGEVGIGPTPVQERAATLGHGSNCALQQQACGVDRNQFQETGPDGSSLTPSIRVYTWLGSQGFVDGTGR